jgi:hypothetical protein
MHMTGSAPNPAVGFDSVRSTRTPTSNPTFEEEHQDPTVHKLRDHRQTDHKRRPSPSRNSTKTAPTPTSSPSSTKPPQGNSTLDGWLRGVAVDAQMKQAAELLAQVPDEVAAQLEGHLRELTTRNIQLSMLQNATLFPRVFENDARRWCDITLDMIVLDVFGPCSMGSCMHSAPDCVLFSQSSQS